MQIKKSVLQNALEVTRSALANREIIEQSTSFVFTKGYIITYNDEISIRYPINLEIEGVIRSDKLYNLLSKIKKEDIDISYSSKNEVEISSGRMKAGITIQPEIKIPLDILEVDGWKELPKNFVESIKFAIPFCGKDMSRPLLTAIHVNKNGFVEASDSYCIVRYTLEKEMPVNTFLIPATAATEIVKINPTTIAFKEKGWIYFRSEDGIVIASRIFDEDKYFDVSSFLEVEGQQIIFPSNTLEVIERASVFAKRDFVLDEKIEMKFENKRLKIKSTSAEGWFEEELNIRYSSESQSIVIPPYLLRDILSKTTKSIISKDRIKFEGENWIYIATLLKK